MSWPGLLARGARASAPPGACSSGGFLAQSGCGCRRSLGRGRQVLVVVIIFLIMRAVVLAWELNRPDVTAARPSPWDMHPALPQLVAEGTAGIVIRSSCSKALDFAGHFPDDGSWFQTAVSHDPAPPGRHQVRYQSPWNRLPYKSCLQFFRLPEPHRSS